MVPIYMGPNRTGSSNDRRATMIDLKGKVLLITGGGGGIGAACGRRAVALGAKGALHDVASGGGGERASGGSWPRGGALFAVWPSPRAPPCRHCGLRRSPGRDASTCW